jgi:hypothetical protein
MSEYNNPAIARLPWQRDDPVVVEDVEYQIQEEEEQPEEKQYQPVDLENQEPQFPEDTKEELRQSDVVAPTREEKSSGEQNVPHLADLENQPAEPDPTIQELQPPEESLLNDRLSFLGASRLGIIKGIDSRHHEVVEKEKSQMRYQPQAPRQPDPVQQVRALVRQELKRVPARVVAPAPQPQEPTRSFSSYRFKKREKPVVQLHNIPGNPNTNFSSLPSTKKHRRK